MFYISIYNHMGRKNKNSFEKKNKEIEKNEKEFIKICEVKNSKKYFRSPQLVLNRTVYITDVAYKILRGQKIEQKKSMAEIVCNLILGTYGQA